MNSRHQQLLHSVVYLGSMAAILEGANQLLRQNTDPHRNMHALAWPFVAATTYYAARRNPQTRAAWHRLPDATDLQHLASGAVLGSGAILTVLGIAASQGWVSAPSWGWRGDQTAHAVLTSVALTTYNQLATVINEEQVFRGYGFDALREATNLPIATITLVGLFAVYHGLEPIQLLTTGIGGILFTLLRLQSRSLWLSIGFHVLWNLWQTAIFGPAGEVPSIRPLHLHGPASWIGRPGAPEPGWLSTIVLALITIGLAIQVWRSARALKRRVG